VATALQCPACGCKHRVDTLAGDAIFSCEQCGRLLKTPPEYRRPDAVAPPPRSRVRVERGGVERGGVERGGAAAADRTSVLTTGVAGTAAAMASESARPNGTRRPAAPARRRAPSRRRGAADLPLRILAWVLAFGLGALLVRFVARATGVVTGDTMIDLLTGTGGWGRFVRVAVIIPVWALFSAVLATCFIEGTRAVLRRRDARPSPVRRPAAQPAPRAMSRSTAAVSQVPRGEIRPPAGASGQRTRRIPRRDVTS
jgi:hypothetical protein